MKRNPVLLCTGLLLLPCCGCTSGSSAAADESSVTDTAVTTAAETASAAHTTAGTTITAAADASAECPETDRNTTTASAVFQGGIGDEANAETPLPEFFVYRFQPDAFSVRLAGGNYQTVLWDFSEAFSHRIDEEYHLEDQDGDGYFDLFIPASYDEESHITGYFVFLWNPVEEKFLTEPLTVDAAE